MLKLTAVRVSDRSIFSPPTIVLNEAHVELVQAELEDVAGLRMIVEPCGRNTAPAIALASLVASPGDILLVLPSDHMICDIENFLSLIAPAADLAAKGWIVTFGMRPVRAETGYGYIERGVPLGGGAFRVERFVEKPDEATASAYWRDGGFDWNAGMFMFRAAVLLEALEEHAPAVLHGVRAALEGADGSSPIRPAADLFARVPAVSLDYAVMEHADNAAVIPAEIGWSDVGSWAALHDLAEKDANGSSVEGNAVSIDARNCLIRSDGPLVAALGVEGLAIIATGDAVLVVPIAQSQRLAALGDLLGKDGLPAALARAGGKNHSGAPSVTQC